jgi:hypothetical protein
MSRWLEKQKMLEAEEEERESERLLHEAEQIALANSVPSPNRTYVSDGTKTVWELINGELSDLGFSAQDLIDHNDMDDANVVIPEGQTLHLPYPRKTIADDQAIRYEVFEQPKQMHVNLVGGTRKQSFSNVKEWSDIKPAGPGFAYKANVEVLAVAYVPIGDEQAAYYLDGLSLGNYQQTGRVAYTIGFNHSHLSEGYAIAAKPDLQKKLDQPAPGIAALPTTLLDISPPETNAHAFKTTYVAYPRPVRFVSSRSIWVHDLAGIRPDRRLEKHQEITIGGVFTKNDILYGRPAGSAKVGLWFGVPMDVLNEEADVYNKVSPLAERVANRERLSNVEQYWYVPLFKTLNQYTKLKKQVKKQINKE